MQHQTQQILIFGEVLFDVFDGKESHLGGAPFNVAWHLQGFGLQPLFVSRIGRDDRGQEILAAMRDWGLRTDAVQVDPVHPTGVVAVTTRDGQPEYEIRAGQAYDFIEWSELSGKPEVATADLLYHGTLALRAGSGQTLAQLKRKLNCPFFLDVNLRDPWWEREAVLLLLKDAQIVKCNTDEFDILAGAATDETGDEWQRAVRLLDQFELSSLIITRGAAGALLYSRGGARTAVKPKPVWHLIDTVGAGDAFSAVMLLGQIKGWPPDHTLRCAVEFAAKVCEVRGAAIRDRQLYKDLIERWQSAQDS